MAKIAFLLPREEMLDWCNQILSTKRLDVAGVMKVDNDSCVQVAKAMQQAGTDIIVARGAQSDMIKNQTEVTVVPIRFTGQELALLLKQAKELSGVPRPRIGIVCYANMIGGTKYLGQVLDIDLSIYIAEDKGQLEIKALQAIEDHMHVVVGGDIVNRCCEEHDVQSIFYTGTEDSLQMAIERAESMSVALDHEKRNTNHLQTLLEFSSNGIIELDNEGGIIRVNHIAKHVLGKEEKRLRGQQLTRYMDKQYVDTFANAVQEGKELGSVAFSINGSVVMASLAPVMLAGEPNGYIFSFHELKKLERMKGDARREQYLNGHVAVGKFELFAQQSETMTAAIKTARIYAQCLEPVMLYGETGTEKELFAQCIHNSSEAAAGPFVSFICDGIEGVEAVKQDANELLYEDQCLREAVVKANGGTLYLEDVHKLSIAAQKTLLRILASRVVILRRELYPVPVQVRLIVSSSQPPQTPALAGGFSPELHYQLTALNLTVPPLRMRREDIPQMVDKAVEKLAVDYSRYVKLAADAQKKLYSYDWPGNLAQLNAFLRRLVLTAPVRMVNEGVVTQLLDELYPMQYRPVPDQSPVIVKSPEAVMLTETLAKHGGDRAAVADELGISKTTLWRKMKKYGIYKKFGLQSGLNDEFFET